MGKRLKWCDNGERVELHSSVWFDACCDCGLVHRNEITTGADDKIFIEFSRDNRRTGQVRRWMKAKQADGQ